MSSQLLTCPNCGAEVDFIFNGVCANCADGEAAEWLARLQPE